MTQIKSCSCLHWQNYRFSNNLIQTPRYQRRTQTVIRSMDSPSARRQKTNRNLIHLNRPQPKTEQDVLSTDVKWRDLGEWWWRNVELVIQLPEEGNPKNPFSNLISCRYANFTESVDCKARDQNRHINEIRHFYWLMLIHVARERKEAKGTEQHFRWGCGAILCPHLHLNLFI